MTREEGAARALNDLRQGLANDGADLALERVDADEVIVRLVITDETCMDCIVAPPLLESLVASELQSQGVGGTVTVIDPRVP